MCFEVAILNKLCNFISLDKSPSQSFDKFENFISYFGPNSTSFNKKIPFSAIIIGDFNAKNDNWWLDDRTATEEFKLDLISQYALKQISEELTHISGCQRSYINLIITNKSNLSLQARNQEFFRAGEGSENKGTLTNI